MNVGAMLTFLVNTHKLLDRKDARFVLEMFEKSSRGKEFRHFADHQIVRIEHLYKQFSGGL